ncbi:hypothetical protein PRN20_18195 [Devosia sp. ZB163]|uniref:portal protein n=1 Tax=Devosia sp. ZB163 TaxID=3025938 RepID=UPI00235E8EAF|nr:hypothetical protein [Devosia sp. ZB163]MDC9825669.1 hypothetical protein [Devosia sp. ZB163]
MIDTGYAPSPAAAAPAQPQGGGRSLERLKREYLGYLDGKTAEVEEQQEARRYYHASQWTAKQIRTFNRRKQPVVTFNRIARKINAVVGLLEKQRQDPRGFARTPKHEAGAEVATAVVRYVLDEQRWAEKSPIVGLNAAVDGIGGVEIILEPGDLGDTEVGFEVVDPSGFFYDPRSKSADFSDASYMGIGKWADTAELLATFPDKRAEIEASVDQGSELTSNPDSDDKWVSGDENHRRVRVIDHWYRVGNDWFYCIYTGAAILAEGRSYLRDQKRRLICKYIMFSANVDHDGDRYGFVRNMKSSQDEINQRRSKGLHTSQSRRIIVRDGQGIEPEKIRAELARPDGVVVVPVGAEMPEFDDAARAAELNASLGFLEEAKAEIENYGFNPALMGTGVQDMSGRAIALQQQAGIAELGPYLLGYKGWKWRLYRAIWNAVQSVWTAERWIRVTDDEELADWLAINQLTVDPTTGQPVIANKLGSLDVDIILDEGPDTVNMQADTNESVREALRSVGPMLSPQVAQAALEVLIDTSAMPASAKAKFRQAASAPQQPNPVQQKAAMVELEGKVAENRKTVAETDKIIAETQDIGADRAADQQNRMLDVVDRQQEQAYRREEHAMDRESGLMDLEGKRLNLRASALRAAQPQSPAQ